MPSTKGGESYVVDLDGSPDVVCPWITLFRDGDNFSASYSYMKTGHIRL